MSGDDTIADALAALDGLIDADGAERSIRGEGAARFLYAMCGHRAVEASLENGRYWVEYWLAASDAAELEPQREETFEDVREAAVSISTWLTEPQA